MTTQTHTGVLNLCWQTHHTERLARVVFVMNWRMGIGEHMITDCLTTFDIILVSQEGEIHIEILTPLLSPTFPIYINKTFIAAANKSATAF